MVASAIVDKYIGESAKLIREMFGESRCDVRHYSQVVPTRVSEVDDEYTEIGRAALTTQRHAHDRVRPGPRTMRDIH